MSKGAVSYALNDRPGLSDETRKRILEIAKELRWYPNRAARSLSAARADACGLVLARPAKTLAIETFFMEFIAGVESELARQFDRADHPARRRSSRTRSPSTGAGGASIGSTACSSSTRASTIRASTSSSGWACRRSRSGGPFKSRKIPAIWHDEARTVVEVVRYLAALGHTRVARVGGLETLRAQPCALERVPSRGARAVALCESRLDRLHAGERRPRDEAASLRA